MKKAMKKSQNQAVDICTIRKGKQKRASQDLKIRKDMEKDGSPERYFGVKFI